MAVLENIGGPCNAYSAAIPARTRSTGGGSNGPVPSCPPVVTKLSEEFGDFVLVVTAAPAATAERQSRISMRALWAGNAGLMP
jgi:hypothetical protein